LAFYEAVQHFTPIPVEPETKDEDWREQRTREDDGNERCSL